MCWDNSHRPHHLQPRGDPPGHGKPEARDLSHRAPSEHPNLSQHSEEGSEPFWERRWGLRPGLYRAGRRQVTLNTALNDGLAQGHLPVGTWRIRSHIQDSPVLNSLAGLPGPMAHDGSVRICLQTHFSLSFPSFWLLNNSLPCAPGLPFRGERMLQTHPSQGLPDPPLHRREGLYFKTGPRRG